MSIFDESGALSREYLLSRGKCCHNGCKNCPYNEKPMKEVINNSVCPLCEAKFHCVCKDGGYPFNCWCMNYTKAVLPKDLPEGDCICEECMKKYSNPVQSTYEQINKDR